MSRNPTEKKLLNCQCGWPSNVDDWKKMKETLFNWHYHSFKIFPQFWLAKSTLVIHHNQLLMTKFRRILHLMNDGKSTAFLHVNAPLTEKTWGQGWVVLVVKTKMAYISLISRVRTRWNNMARTAQRHWTRRVTIALWRIFAELNNTERALSKMNLTL